MPNGNDERNDEMDRFWDIGRLVPPKPKNATSKKAVPSVKTEAVTISVASAPASQKRQEQTENALTAPTKPIAKKPSVYTEYAGPSPFLQNTRVINWKSTYSYYDFFCRQAIALYPKKGSECPPAEFSPYFSYVAQYSQLNRRQLDWYLWWRECVRNKTYPKTGISYIHLMVYEIINLGELIDTRASAELLLALWRNYRIEFPQLNGTLAEWIGDYCLIHRLPVPYKSEEEEAAFLGLSMLPEAFCSFQTEDSARFAKFLLSFCCAYDYRKSKFYTEENAPVYDHYVPFVLHEFLKKTDPVAWVKALPRKTVSRMAFTGALCASQRRKHIEIEYISLCDSHGVRSLVGDIIKYIENKLRSHLGVRSRLNVSALNPKITDTLDDIFKHSHLTSDTRAKQIPEYEKLYDAKETEFSIESALGIEQASWEITERLVEAFEEDDLPCETESHTVEATPVNRQETEGASEVELFWERLGTNEPFFRLILSGNRTEQQAYVRRNRILPDAVVDEINESAVEIFGDILIEQADDGRYLILEEYRSTFE